MKVLVLAFLFLVISCAQRVERISEPMPVYYPPARGTVEDAGRGLFIRTGCNDYVRAVEEGRVVYSGRDVGGYGWVVIIEQRDGLVSVYGKMGRPWVRAGERVKVRQVIGKVGKGRGVCGLYYELRDRKGDPVEPRIRW